MRFIHIADLHLGKSIYGMSLIESGDQTTWVDRFLGVVDVKQPDAVVIAGDVFDRSAPSEDAVRLFSRMVTELHERNVPVLTVAGNHDSVYRLSYFGNMLSELGVHFSAGLNAGGPVLNHVTLNDEHGPVTFWLMPYVFPALVQNVLDPEHEDENLRDYDKAVRALLAAQPINTEERNIIVAHQNVTANGQDMERGGSESMVGGVGQIDYTAFDGFEYAALGHIHATYHVGRKAVRYSGSPLCYHFDETHQAKKGPLLVTIGEKGTEPEIETIHIEPLHPLKDLRGTYNELREAEQASENTGEFVRITLTDQRVSPEISQFFRELYSLRGSVLMEIRSEYSAFSGSTAKVTSEKLSALSVEELFADFYRERSGSDDPTDDELELMNFAGEIMRNADVHEEPSDTIVDKLLAHLLEKEGGAR